MAGSENLNALKPAGSSPVLTILTGINLVVTLGLVSLQYLSFQREKMRPSIEDISNRISKEEGGEGHEGGKGEEKAEGHGGAHGEGKEVEKKKMGEFGKMINLEQFTVNLSTPGSSNSKFVRVDISIQVLSEEIENEINVKMPQVRNAVIDLFNSKRPADLATIEGREYLKEEIKTAINGFLVSGKIKGVFFTSFALAG